MIIKIVINILKFFQIVENINNALITPQTVQKVHYFAKLKELLLYKSPNLLPKYIGDMMNFATDKHQDVKRALVGFIEELW